jgi:hypothetical protein
MLHPPLPITFLVHYVLKYPREEQYIFKPCEKKQDGMVTLFSSVDQEYKEVKNLNAILFVTTFHFLSVNQQFKLFAIPFLCPVTEGIL